MDAAAVAGFVVAGRVVRTVEAVDTVGAVVKALVARGAIRVVGAVTVLVVARTVVAIGVAHRGVVGQGWLVGLTQIRGPRGAALQ